MTQSKSSHASSAPDTNAPVTVAVDVMSGDRDPNVAINAAFDCMEAYAQLELILVGDYSTMAGLLKSRANHVTSSRFRLQHASQVVAMDESPRKALRGKKDSSMRVAIDLVKQGSAQACISAGNTGALMATAHFVLKTLPGIDRPAIVSPIPSQDGHTLMLDLGANTDCKPEHLFQFGVMGSALAQATYNTQRPTVGLLNVGEEDIKGNAQVKEAATLLSRSGLNYIGFVEGNDTFSGRVDVVVSDGFVGNVALKTIEGLASMIADFMRQEFTRNFFTKCLAVIAYPVIKALKKRMDPRLYNGASLLGLNGVVIKSHGGADRLSFATAINTARLEAEKQVPQRIASALDYELSKDTQQ